MIRARPLAGKGAQEFGIIERLRVRRIDFHRRRINPFSPIEVQKDINRQGVRRANR